MRGICAIRLCVMGLKESSSPCAACAADNASTLDLSLGGDRHIQNQISEHVLEDCFSLTRQHSRTS